MLAHWLAKMRTAFVTLFSTPLRRRQEFSPMVGGVEQSGRALDVGLQLTFRKDGEGSLNPPEDEYCGRGVGAE